jgi:DNA modification methylase
MANQISDERFKCAYDKLVDIDTLQPNPKNPNKHPDRQIEMLAKIIKYQGQRAPIVVSNRSGFITKGHGRLMALQKLGFDKVAVDYQDYADEAQEYADMVADNKIAELAEHDDKFMTDIILAEFPDIDLELLGLDDFTLEMPFEGKTDEDAVPDNAPARVQLGDVYQLGEHRLMCGDSTDKKCVEYLMNGEKADMVFTDPPYNLEENGQLKRTNKTESKTESFGDWDVGFNPVKSLENMTNFTTENSHIFVCTSSYLFGSKHDWFKKQNHKPNYLVWCKANPMPSLSKKSFVQSTELIVHSRKGSPNFIYPSGANLKNIIYGNVQKHEFGYPTQKPLYVVEHCIAPTSGSVLDLFGGSGSTLIACEKTKRKCFMMELDPHYCDVIIKRWEDFTGQQAKLVSSPGEKQPNRGTVSFAESL